VRAKCSLSILKHVLRTFTTVCWKAYRKNMIPHLIFDPSSPLSRLFPNQIAYVYECYGLLGSLSVQPIAVAFSLLFWVACAIDSVSRSLASYTMSKR
jgi:hypothetical protein